MTDEELKERLDAEHQRRLLRKLLDGAREFYKDPENKRAYQEWAKSEEGQRWLKAIGEI